MMRILILLALCGGFHLFANFEARAQSQAPLTAAQIFELRPMIRSAVLTKALLLPLEARFAYTNLPVAEADRVHRLRLEILRQLYPMPVDTRILKSAEGLIADYLLRLTEGHPDTESGRRLFFELVKFLQQKGRGFDVHAHLEMTLQGLREDSNAESFRPRYLPVLRRLERALRKRNKHEIPEPVSFEKLGVEAQAQIHRQLNLQLDSLRTRLAAEIDQRSDKSACEKYLHDNDNNVGSGG